MSKSRFSLIEHPWLLPAGFYHCHHRLSDFQGSVILVGVFKLTDGASTTSFWMMLLSNLLLLFIIVPFVLGFPKRSHPYETYLSEIRLTLVKPLLRLILLGVSCYLILALCRLQVFWFTVSCMVYQSI